jgi:hypothetical protein
LLTDKLPFSLPVVSGTYTAIATSSAGTSTAETVTESLNIDGFDVFKDKQIADFPIDIPTALGAIVGKVWTEVDATLTLAVTNP